MIEVLSFIGMIAGGLVALGIIWKQGLLPMYHFMQTMQDAHHIILEFPIWKDKVDEGLKQLQPNGGNSVKDIVNSTKDDMTELKSNVMDLKNLVEGHVQDPDAHNRRGI